MSQSRKEQRAEAAEARRAARDSGGGAATASAKPARERRKPRERPVEDRPQGYFGNWPVSEIAIVAGVLLVVIGFTQGPTGNGQTRLLGGIGMCAVGVFEFTFREHFRGYRSHTALLAGVPAAIIHGITLLVAPHGSIFLYVVLVPDVIVYALAFQVLRGVYKRAAAGRAIDIAHAKT